MNTYLETLTAEFKNNADLTIAAQQKDYMRGQFEYFGLKTELRRQLQKPFLVKAYLPSKEESEILVKRLWLKSEREFHYFAQELAFKYIGQQELKDIVLYEFMVSHNSWWDTVDFISTKLMGSFFKQYPEQRSFYVKKWLESNNIWLQRSALLFQLKYKSNLDTHLLSATINSLLDSNEFFINKAIGWVLREYSRTNSKWVSDFVYRTQLSNLSKREALRLMAL